MIEKEKNSWFKRRPRMIITRKTEKLIFPWHSAVFGIHPYFRAPVITSSITPLEQSGLLLPLSMGLQSMGVLIRALKIASISMESMHSTRLIIVIYPQREKKSQTEQQSRKKTDFSDRQVSCSPTKSQGTNSFSQFCTRLAIQFLYRYFVLVALSQSLKSLYRCSDD
uniref:Uncharacterized protein n=1 Tax=Romanomermis culicivorax TaxID=13658 RepID=A0A915IRA3_ROMCU